MRPLREENSAGVEHTTYPVLLNLDLFLKVELLTPIDECALKESNLFLDLSLRAAHLVHGHIVGIKTAQW